MNMLESILYALKVSFESLESYFLFNLGCTYSIVAAVKKKLPVIIV